MFRSKESDEQKTCEAYVTLGRLHHVRDRHQRDTQRLKDALKERVDDAYREAANRVRGEVCTKAVRVLALY